MAATAVHPAMNGDKLFPLFTKAGGSNEPTAERPIQHDHSEVNGLDGTNDDKPTKATRVRKPKTKQVPGQKTLQEIVNPKAVPNATPAEVNDNDEAFDTQKDGPSPRRSKRRRTSRLKSIEVGGQDEQRADGPRPEPERHSSPQVIISASSPLPVEPERAAMQRTVATPPKKMLRLKAGGKFSSPVSKASKDEEGPVEPVKKKGRPRKAREIEQERHLVAVIKFDVETDLGERIDRILAGEERYKRQVKIVPKKQGTPRKAGQTAHPFFSLDRRKEQPPSQPSPRKTSAVTPGKLRRETQNPNHVRSANEVVEVWTSTLLKDRLMFKHPGAKEPAWPDHEQTHVRGLSQADLEAIAHDSSASATPRRKRKSAKKGVFESDSLLRHFSSHLKVEKDGEIRADGFREPHPSLRVPARLLIPGQEIEKRVATQLSVPLVDPNTDELSYAGSSQQPTHAALQSTYAKISTWLSAFDEGKGDAAAWAQKYAPSSCEEVLQPARQMKVLKEWLLSLKVTTVENASKLNTKTTSKPESKPKKRKRRRKEDDLDDFLVESDEEMHDMDELTDSEDVQVPSRGRKNLHSIVQVAIDGAKLSNAVLLSGPHGCGKTAAAYAAARELGFKVFEISSSERRSGKDVLDKVGDMTENHLVKHHGTESGEQSSTEEPNIRLDEAFQRDLASGRQGKMASFFKPQAEAQPKKETALPKDTVKSKALEAVQNVLKKPPKDQQQSLILLEEVDVLFKEDKDFWTTVLKLVTTSKRPFIMTCNDEDLVPLQAMSLHAILRFTPPPVDLATDYLLLIAAAEGHLLERDAVLSLYRSKHSDLRAAISELDLWCQMSVGDPRGGLSWIFQRYPPGSDLDGQGRRLRVVSEGTYRTNMGSSVEVSSGAEDKLMWAWREHGIDASTALGWEADSVDDSAIKIKDFCKFADDLSAADVFAHDQSSNHLDTSQNAMSDKARSHYIDGLPLLQTDEHADSSAMGTELFTTSNLLAFRARGLLSSTEINAKLDVISSYEHSRQEHTPLTRRVFTCFDTISTPAESALSSVSGLQQSVFDGPLEPIATDIAPYVRSIVHFDVALAEQREALGGGKGAKRARTTRAARSALEGGQRASTRRERWFSKALDVEAVLTTGGQGWPKMMAAGTQEMDGGEGECTEGGVASSTESI